MPTCPPGSEIKTPAQLIDLATARIIAAEKLGPTQRKAGDPIVLYVPAPERGGPPPSQIPNVETETVTQAEIDARAVQAAAIMYAESGGCVKIVNVNGSASSAPGSRDRGLWQFNDRIGPLVGRPDDVAFDPIAATDAAYRASRGFKSWGPWVGSHGLDHTHVTYTTIVDTFESMLGRAVEEIPLTPVDVSTVTGVFGTLFGWAEALGKLLSTLISVAFWRRLGIGALGLALAVAGIIVLVKDSAPTSFIRKAVS